MLRWRLRQTLLARNNAAHLGVLASFYQPLLMT